VPVLSQQKHSRAVDDLGREIRFEPGTFHSLKAFRHTTRCKY
jgi:hypothetical protein